MSSPFVKNTNGMWYIWRIYDGNLKHILIFLNNMISSVTSNQIISAFLSSPGSSLRTEIVLEPRRYFSIYMVLTRASTAVKKTGSSMSFTIWRLSRAMSLNIISIPHYSPESRKKPLFEGYMKVSGPQVSCDLYIPGAALPRILPVLFSFPFSDWTACWDPKMMVWPWELEQKHILDSSVVWVEC